MYMQEARNYELTWELVKYHPDDFVVFLGGIFVLMFRSLPPEIYFVLYKQ